MTHKILIVEDSQVMRQLMEVSLGRVRGLEVHSVDDGLAAIRRLAEGGFSLVIADINMPVMDGIKLVRHIRGDASLKQIPVVIVSTEGAKSDIGRVAALGVQAYLTKPVSGSQLTETVRRLLPI